MVVTKGSDNLKIRVGRTDQVTQFLWLKKAKKFKDASFNKNHSKPYDVLILGDDLSEINPRMYDEHPISPRDMYINQAKDSMDAYTLCEAIRDGKKIIAIGRSAQLACIAAGGSVMQFADGHAKYNLEKKKHDELDTEHCHTIKCFDGFRGHVTSHHHSLMYPFIMNKEDYSVLAYTIDANSNWYYDSNHDNKDSYLFPPTEQELHSVKSASEESTVDVEAVLFRNINCLAIQYDPCSLYVHESREEELKWTLALASMFVEDKL